MATLRKKRPNCKRDGKNNLANCSRTQTDPHAQRISVADFEKVRDEIINLVCSRALETVDQMIKHVRAGNFQAMKYLFEMVGLFPVSASEAATPDDSLARRLLNYLEPAERVVGNTEVASLAPTGENRS